MALEHTVGQEAVQQEAAAMLQEPDVNGADCGDGAVRADVGDVAPLGEETVRRTIYVQVRRSMPLGVLVPFNPPAMKPNCALRTSSTDSPQALMMMNDPFVIEQVNRLAARVAHRAGESAEARFQLAWRLVLGRLPTTTEVRGGLRASSPDAPNPELAGLAHLCQVLVSSNGFLYDD